MMLPVGSSALLVGHTNRPVPVVVLCVVRRLHLTPIAIAILVAGPTTLRAQMSRSEVGNRLRITLVSQPDAPLVGIALGSRDGTLYLRRPSHSDGSSDTIAIQQSQIQRLEVSHGTHGHFLVGMLVGGAAGAGLGAAAASGTHSGFYGGSGDWTPVGAVVGGIGGLLIGGVVGELVRTERWTTISPTVAWRSTPGRSTRTLALGVQVPW